MLGLRRKGLLGKRGTIATTHGPLDSMPNMFRRYTQIVQDPDGHAILIVDQTQQQVFCADVVMAKTFRLLLSISQNTSSLFVKRLRAPDIIPFPSMLTSKRGRER